MTTEQTVNTEVQALPAWEEKKLLRSGFNKAFGIAILILIIANIVGGILQVIMMMPLTFELLQSGMDPQEASIRVTEIMTQQLKYMYIPNTIGFLAAYGIMFPVGCKMMKLKFKDFFSTKKFSGKLVGLGVILALGTQIAFSLLGNGAAWLLEQVGVKANTINMTLDGDILGMSVFVFYFCIVAPIFEEILFRGFLMKALSKKNVWFGIIASSVVFGLYHGNLQQFIGATAMGMAMALVATKSDSLIPSIIMHFAMNVNAVAQQFVLYYAGETALEIMSITEIIVFILGAIAVLVFKRKMFAPEKNQDEASADGEKVNSFKVLLSSWTAWVFFAIMLVLIAVSMTMM